MSLEKLFIPRGKKILLEGKYFSMNLTSSSNQTMSIESINKYKDLVRRINGFGDVMETEFHIPLTRRGKPLKKIKTLLEGFNVQTKTVDAEVKANTALSRMTIIVESLRKVKSVNFDAFTAIKRNLVKESSGQAYWGFIFELLIAARLADADIKFDISSRRNGAADFSVETDRGIVEIECHALFPIATHLDSEGIKQKIHNGISSKEKKNYAGSNCALFIDTTNLEKYHIPGIPYDTTVYIPDVSKFGNVTLFSSHTKLEGKEFKYGQGWNPKYYDSCTPQLKQILARCIPIDGEPTQTPIDGVLSF